jgi:CysZ protein
MALLSEKTEKILTGNHYSFDAGQFIRDVVRGMVLAFRNLVIEIAIVGALWFLDTYLTLVAAPAGVLLAPILAILSFFISSYFYGFSALDYTNERKRLSIGRSIRFIRDNKGLAVGNGLVFNLLFKVPFIGPTIATVTCTVAATIAIHEKDNKMPNE